MLKSSSILIKAVLGKIRYSLHLQETLFRYEKNTRAQEALFSKEAGSWSEVDLNDPHAVFNQVISKTTMSITNPQISQTPSVGAYVAYTKTSFFLKKLPHPSAKSDPQSAPRRPGSS